MLIDEIKKANLETMKARDSVRHGILSIVIGKYTNLEIENKSKQRQTTDMDMLNIIKKTLKELDDELAGHVLLGRQDKIAEIKTQKETIEVYLPKQLSEQEIKEVIVKQKLTKAPVGQVMQYFKNTYGGQVDMSLVSKIVRGNQ